MTIRAAAERRPVLVTVALLATGVLAMVLSMLAAVSLGGEGVTVVNVRDILSNHLNLTDIAVLTYKDVIV